MNHLTSLLADPEISAEWFEDLKLDDWDIIIRQGRASGMLGTLHHQLEKTDQLIKVPERPKQHLLSARTMSDRQTEKIIWEVKNIHRTMVRAGIPVIILKGAAYSFINLLPSHGRIFGDIDIMVPQGALTDAENHLKRSGWLASHHSDYDDHYYRRWTHEIPPLVHGTRKTVLDVHHNILPITARLKPQAKELWDKVLPVTGYDDLYVLGQADMILHSAAHLFHEGEFERGFRNLYDIAQLIQQFRHLEDFWDNLCERAFKLDLVIPLNYALRYTHKILNLAIPVLEQLNDYKRFPSEKSLILMDKLFLNALRPAETSSIGPIKAATDWMLFVRGHYLRMPLHLLIPHLFYKATFAKLDAEKQEQEKSNINNLLQNFLDQ